MSNPCFFTPLALAAIGFGSAVIASETIVSDQIIADQRAALATQTHDRGFGPQAPRDLGSATGNNTRTFAAAPAHTNMNLCNIHFHEGAEHKGGEFTTFNGNGDGKGYGTGYAYNGTLTEAEKAAIDYPVGNQEHGALAPGDTIEVHYVFSTAQVTPGHTLNACFDDAISNPQLRVETQVYVLVNDTAAADFMALTAVGRVDGYHQAVNIPADTGAAIAYTGSTTGPGFNETASPLQVSWAVRPQVKKVNIASVATWLEGNVFEEDHAHGVRNLVINPDLLAPMTQ